MLAVTNAAEQIVEAGATVVFNQVTLKACCSESFQSLQNAIRLNRNAIYIVDFEANITGATAATAVELSIAVNGTPIPASRVTTVPAAAGDLSSVSRRIPIYNACNETLSISVTNTGTTPVTIAANPILFVDPRHA